MATAIDSLIATDLDDLADEVLRDVLRTTQREVDRLVAFRSKGTAALKRRLVKAAGVGREQRGIQDARRFLTDELRLSPSEAKRTERVGQALEQATRTQDAFGAGDLSQEHAKVITDTLRRLAGEDRDRVEQALVDAARTQDPVALGRTARRLLAETDYDAAVKDDRARHAQRSARLTQRPDGGVALYALLYGLQAERAWTAYNAHLLPDPPGEHHRRSPEQRGADALDEIFDAALRSGAAPARHGVRPHVEVVIQYGDLARMAGVAELGFTGPITIAEIRTILTDSSVCRVIVGADSVPIEVSKRTRYVQIGLWTALKHRDKGCAWSGCTAPPSWCEVAHGNVPFAAGGKLSLDNAVLLCKRHHRSFDNGDYELRIHGATVTFEPQPVRGPP